MERPSISRANLQASFIFCAIGNARKIPLQRTIILRTLWYKDNCRATKKRGKNERTVHLDDRILHLDLFECHGERKSNHSNSNQELEKNRDRNQKREKNPQKIRRKEAGEAELHKTCRRRETKKKRGQRKSTKARVLCRKSSSPPSPRSTPPTYLRNKNTH
jgi:hypothetical protein